MGSQDAFILGDQWQCACGLLPSDLEETAKSTGALKRKRRLQDAQTLLRLALAYSFTDLSLRDVSAWAHMAGLADLSDVAVLKRLRCADKWLSHLLGQELLAHGVQEPDSCGTGRRLRVIDASVVTSSGAKKGPHWRVHLSLRLAPLLVDDVQVSDWTEAETLTHFDVKPGDILLADRVYATRASLARVVEAEADVIVRFPWSNLPMQDGSGQPLDLPEQLRAHLGDMPAGTVHEFSVQTLAHKEIPAISGRVVAIRRSQQAAEAQRRKVKDNARRLQYQLEERTLALCDYFFVFTTLPAEQFDASLVLALYRLRWQVELCFKRLKGIIGMDHLRAKDKRLCRTYLLGNLLAGLLAEGLAHRWLGFSPWGVGNGREANTLSLAAV